MSIARRTEVIAATLIVVFGVFYTRAEWIPASAEMQVELAEERLGLDVAEPNRWFSAWSVGDGQAFAVIAADPTGEKLGEEIKEPIYRFSRAGYGWLAFVASAGQESWVPYGMAIVGAASVAGVLWLSIRLRDRIGWRTWLLILNPALYIGFAGDTAEPLAIFLLAFGMAFGSVWAAVALGVTRPSYLLAKLRSARLFLWGVASALLLLIYGILRFGTDQLFPDPGRIALPVTAYAEHSSLAGWALLTFGVATLAVGFRRRDWAWIASGLLVVALGPDVTANPANAWRAAGMLPVLWAFGTGFRPAIGGQAGGRSPEFPGSG